MKLGFISLGCPKNLVDGEVMLGLAREAGHEITPDASSAEVIVVNTCAFIDTAKEESIDAILEMAQLKRQGSCKKLVVTGCLAERYRDQLRAEIPEIDVVLGTVVVVVVVGGGGVVWLVEHAASTATAAASGAASSAPGATRAATAVSAAQSVGGWCSPVPVTTFVSATPNASAATVTE